MNESFEAIAVGDFNRAVRLSNKRSDPFLPTVHEGLRHTYSSLLGVVQLRARDEIEKGERLLWVLSSFISLAPLLGLLG